MTDELDFSTVLASTVHDMKNSLGMLLNSLDEVRDSVSGDVRGSRPFTTLEYEAQRVHGDLIQLLSLYRLSEEKLCATVEEQLVSDFLDEQHAHHERLLEGLEINLEVHTEPDSEEGYFDTQLVSGVLTNVINNAIRYARSQLHLNARTDDGWLVLSVEDDGPGYPESMLAVDFSGTERVDFSTGSTNLGLYFAQRMAGMHTVGNRQGFTRLRNGGALGGSVFELWLP
ncbi:HAMP domain-containing sensor histidine kinase [Salicola sp. Rm-C-2C1-2]|uniref:sensor histidine kinase n=1 Tax=Salicola sp. Rm-C-2C1-2 TaxID=3141321 RepID=UPI0032E389ED